MIAYIEAASGIGCMCGPAIGSALFSLGGYSFIFYSFGSIFIFLTFFIKIIFPKKIDKIYCAVVHGNFESDSGC